MIIRAVATSAVVLLAVLPVLESLSTAERRLDKLRVVPHSIQDDAESVPDIENIAQNVDEVKTIGRQALDVEEQASMPWWTTVCSTVTGQLDCDEQIKESDVQDCSPEQWDAHANISHVLKHHFLSDDIFDATYLLGNNEGRKVTTCKANQGSADSGARLIIDARYSNTPRCCSEEERDGLVFHDHGQLIPWTYDAIHAMENRSGDLIIEPSINRCTDQNKCALVVQLGPTGGGVPGVNSWALIAAHCKQCQDELNAILMTPELFFDVWSMRDGEKYYDGCSNDELNKHFFPYVESFIADPSNHVDPDRVYLLALSKAVDTALRVAMRRPDMFAVVSLAGKFLATDETMAMLDNPDGAWRQDHGESRLNMIQFNVGDIDTVFPDEEFYGKFNELLTKVKRLHMNTAVVDVRIFAEARHSIWYAAWNLLHDTIWTGKEPKLENRFEQLDLTC